MPQPQWDMQAHSQSFFDMSAAAILASHTREVLIMALVMVQVLNHRTEGRYIERREGLGLGRINWNTDSALNRDSRQSEIVSATLIVEVRG